jgi:hypothetical protein
MGCNTPKNDTPPEKVCCGRGCHGKDAFKEAGSPKPDTPAQAPESPACAPKDSGCGPEPRTP